MKIIIAPDSFKESLSAEKCYQTIKAGFSTIFPDAHYICLPIAGDGKGTAEAMVTATGSNIVTLEVCESMSGTVNAFYSLTGDGETAMIEMATASGLMPVAPEKRNPLLTSSLGTGELIRHILDNSIRHTTLGVSGGAMVDDGMGMAQALGVCFLDADSQVLATNGGNLTRVTSIEMGKCDPRLASCRVEVVCGVDSPLVGARGAAAVFSPQEGATPEVVEELGQGLQSYARVLQQQAEINVCQMTGGDTVGGMGIVTAVFLNADIKPGAGIVLNAANLAQTVQDATLVITGKGRIGSQTTGGKAPLGVASVAKQSNVPVIGIAGILDDDVGVVHQYGIDAVFSILPRLALLAEVLADGETNPFNSTRNIARTIKIGQGIKN